MDKLEKYGIRNNEINWFTSYLSERKQGVKYNNCTSTMMSLSSGVPQESVLGAALFLLLIIDLTMSVKNCNIHVYADDTMLDAPGENVTDVTQNLQREIHNVTEWFKNKRLKVNPNKCCSMLVGTRQCLGNSPKVQLLD